MKNLIGSVAAITGAGSGIGRALAIKLANSGCHIAISDVDEIGLADTLKQVQRSGMNVTSQKLDVADRAAMYAWADQVVSDHGKVNMIFNNAGVALSDTVETMNFEDLEWLMDINFWGVVSGTKAFLPHIKKAGEGNVVNISSVFGMIAVPTQSAYNAAKFAVKGFTECLIQELNIEGSAVHAMCVHPGGIRTNIAGNGRIHDSGGALGIAGASAAERTAEFHKKTRTSPAQAADRIIAGVLKNKRRVLIGNDAWLIDKIQRLLPLGYQRILEMLAKRSLRSSHPVSAKITNEVRQSVR